MLSSPTRILCFVALVVGCGPKAAEQPVPAPVPAVTTAPPVEEPAADGGDQAGPCAVDADCVPASCCHASSCVPAAQKPDCSAVMCTMNCQPETMDCGGRCACEAGSCKAILAAP